MSGSDKKLLYAILAMDAYNRGYDPGIALPDAKGTAIGPAKISDRIQDFEGFASQAQAADFLEKVLTGPAMFPRYP